MLHAAPLNALNRGMQGKEAKHPGDGGYMGAKAKIRWASRSIGYQNLLG
jgi:hypothetical protein